MQMPATQKHETRAAAGSWLSHAAVDLGRATRHSRIMAQTAAAALLAPFPPLTAPGPGAEESAQRIRLLQSVQSCLEGEVARAAAARVAAKARTAAAQQALQQGCSVAEEQHQEIAAALEGLAARLCYLLPAGASALPPLLSLNLPARYARACTQLLDLLAGFVQHHIDSETCSAISSAAEQQQHRGRVLELEQLQSGACKAERLRVEEEAEEARWDRHAEHWLPCCVSRTAHLLETL